MNDALIHAELKNNATDTDSLNYFISGTYNIRSGHAPNMYFGANNTSTPNNQEILDTIISDTTIKRACCLGNKVTDPEINGIQAEGEYYKVGVRIPIPGELLTDLDGDGTSEWDWLKLTEVGKVMDSFNFYDKDVYIPVGDCPVNHNPTDDGEWGPCDDFYSVYCKNMYDFFNDINGGNVNYKQRDFATYKPECACYGDMSGYEGLGMNTQPACVLYGCDIASSATMYLDPSSRQIQTAGCDTTICSTVYDLSDMTVGGNVEWESMTEQACDGSSPTRLYGTDDVTSGGGGGSGSGTYDPVTGEPIANADLTSDDPVESWLSQNKYIVGGVIFCCCLLFLFLMLSGGGGDSEEFGDDYGDDYGDEY